MGGLNIKLIKIFLFLSLLLLIGVSFATDMNETEVSHENIETTQKTINERTVYTENIFENEQDYDISDDLNEINQGSSDVNLVDIKVNNNLDKQNSNIKEIYVNPNANINNQNGSSTSPYRYISTAVDNATNNYINIIHLSAGNHLLPSHVQISKTIVFVGDNKDTTNITCSFNQGFRVSNNANLSIEKVRMQYANYSQGGAILAGINTSISINDCIFNNNYANNGAVLFVSGTSAKVNITNSRFENNTDVRYGALQLGGINSIYNVEDCVFINNILTSDNFSNNAGGAAIYTSAYAITSINRCIFTNNKANWGNAILLGNHGNLYITYSNFTNNIANANTGSTNKTKGGAIAIGSGYAEIGHCYFLNNKADVGGAITINSGEIALIYSSVFQQNLAYTQAGAINNYGTLTVRNSRFIKNNGTRRGGAILDIGNNDILIENCNFVNNRVLTSLIQGNSMVPQGGAISIAGNCHTFTIKNSIFNHSSAYYGGAIYSEIETRLIYIENTLFHNNTAHLGAAMIIAGDTILTMKNDSFNHNRALKQGGAIIINGSVLASINNTKFQNNNVSITGMGDGGAIYIACHASLDFNNCEFNANYANIRGGAICSMSVVTITISRSNITNNQATTGSAIYIDNTNNYQSHISKIMIDTSSFVNNIGNYIFYSVKQYDSTWNKNIISTSWWGSNVVSNSLVYNFNIKNYFLLTINVNYTFQSNITWTNNNISFNSSQYGMVSIFTLSFTILKEGNLFKYTDAFLQPRTFTIKKNNSLVQEYLDVNYHLNINMDKIEINMDNQKITIRR